MVMDVVPVAVRVSADAMVANMPPVMTVRAPVRAAEDLAKPIPPKGRS